MALTRFHIVSSGAHVVGLNQGIIYPWLKPIACIPCFVHSCSVHNIACTLLVLIVFVFFFYTFRTGTVFVNISHI